MCLRRMNVHGVTGIRQNIVYESCGFSHALGQAILISQRRKSKKSDFRSGQKSNFVDFRRAARQADVWLFAHITII